MYNISNSDEWKETIKLDEKNIIYYGFDAPFGKYSSKYSLYSSFKHKGGRKYSEDFAESVALYLIDNQWFKRTFRHKFEFLRQLFKGDVNERLYSR